MAIRVMLADDHTIVREGFRSLIEGEEDMEVIGEASDGRDAVKLTGKLQPDVVIMDLLMPGGMDGIETTHRVRAITPHTQVVVLTAHTDDARVVAALRAGAIGYVRKDAKPEILLAAVQAAARGQSLLDPAIADSVLHELESSPGHDLTGREMEVLRLLAHGRTNREIATDLIVGEETIKTHVGNILAKLHLAHRTQVVIHALKQGMISLDEIEL